MRLVGRTKEQSELMRYFHSGKPELKVPYTMITTYGVAKKGYFASVQSEIILDDLFV